MVTSLVHIRHAKEKVSKIPSETSSILATKSSPSVLSSWMDKAVLLRNSEEESQFLGSTVHLMWMSVSAIGTTEAIGE
jgi:hypothetical protein